jgi:hypothetical protein
MTQMLSSEARSNSVVLLIAFATRDYSFIHPSDNSESSLKIHNLTASYLKLVEVDNNTSKTSDSFARGTLV